MLNGNAVTPAMRAAYAERTSADATRRALLAGDLRSLTARDLAVWRLSQRASVVHEALHA